MSHPTPEEKSDANFLRWIAKIFDSRNPGNQDSVRLIALAAKLESFQPADKRDAE
jgi:hypothetical protein